jgi:hypothetical protein
VGDVTTVKKMSKQEYRRALKQLGLSIVGAGPVFGIHRRHSQRIAAGETPVPKPVAKLVRLMVKLGVKPEEVE